MYSMHAPKTYRPPSGSLLQYVSWCQGQCLGWEGLSSLSRTLASLVGRPWSSELVPAAQGPSNLGSSDWIGLTLHTCSPAIPPPHQSSNDPAPTTTLICYQCAFPSIEFTRRIINSRLPLYGS